MRPVHSVRYVVLAVLGIAALIAAALADAALAAVLVIMAAGLVLLVVPFVVIHFDEHEERLKHGGPGAHTRG